VGPVPEHAVPDDYEAALAPLYAWMDAVADLATPDKAAAPQSASASIWQTLAGEGPRPLRGRMLAGLLPLGIGTLNRLGLGPVRADLSGEELRRAGLGATREMAVRLGLRCEHLIYGHTHRTGPLRNDDGMEWQAPAGWPALVNAGCWVYEEVFIGRGRSSPYWPGGAVSVDGHGAAPPVLERLLLDVPGEQLSPGRSRP